MPKNILYIIIFILAIWLGYELTNKDMVSDPESGVVTEPVVVEDVPEEVVATTTSPEAAVPNDAMVLEGTFMSLVEGQSSEARADLRKTFYYMLVDDGTEIVRVDLRPLLQYSTIDPEEKLGVVRGDRVVITGSMNATGFEVVSVERAGE